MPWRHPESSSESSDLHPLLPLKGSSEQSFKLETKQRLHDKWHELSVPEVWRTGQTTKVLDRLRSDVILTRDVWRHGRDFGWMAARREDGAGFERLEVD